MLYTKNLKI